MASYMRKPSRVPRFARFLFPNCASCGAPSQTTKTDARGVLASFGNPLHICIYIYMKQSVLVSGWRICERCRPSLVSRQRSTEAAVALPFSFVASRNDPRESQDIPLECDRASFLPNRFLVFDVVSSLSFVVFSSFVLFVCRLSCV